jgi:exocyst complex component 2
MYTLEDWQIEDLQYGITSLPLTFEATMRALLSELEGVPQADDPLIVYIQKSFVECIEIFADNLHHLSMVALEGLVGSLPNVSNMNVDYSPYYDDGRNIPGADARLLLTLNNCRFTRTQIIPDLLVRYQKEFNRPLYKFNMAAVYLFEDIERMCAQKYVANKVVVFKSLIKSGILFSGFDWATQSPPLGIRDFIMTILMNLIFVHDELYRLSKSFVDSTLASLVERTPTHPISLRFAFQVLTHTLPLQRSC